MQFQKKIGNIDDAKMPYDGLLVGLIGKAATMAAYVHGKKKKIYWLSKLGVTEDNRTRRFVPDMQGLFEICRVKK